MNSVAYNQCEWCGLPTRAGGNHNSINGCVAALKKNITNLFKQIGEPSQCRGCGAEIYWVVHRSGKRAPYTPLGLNHFADCPAAASFKKD